MDWKLPRIGWGLFTGTIGNQWPGTHGENRDPEYPREVSGVEQFSAMQNKKILGVMCRNVIVGRKKMKEG